MRFQPGKSGNPVGRPKGSYGGRIKALAGLDAVMAKSRNRRILERALEADFRKDPVRFFKTVIMPLLPRDSKIELDKKGLIQWTSLVGDGQQAPALPVAKPPEARTCP